MSADQQPLPATVKIAAAAHDDIGRLCGAVSDLSLWVRAIASQVGAQLPGSDDLEWAGLRAAVINGQVSVDRIRSEMAAARAAAARQSALPSIDAHGDGSRLRPGTEPAWAAKERQDYLAARGGQAARHMAMAAGKAPMDVGDAHPQTRKIREEIYAGLVAEKERN